MVFLIDKVENVLFSPEAFFRQIFSGESVKDAILYSIIMIGIYSILSLLITLAVMRLNIQIEGKYTMVSFTLGSIAYILIRPFLIFFFIFCIATVVLYIISLFVGSRPGIGTAFKLIVYSMTPLYAFGWIPYIGFPNLLNLMSFYLNKVPTNLFFIPPIFGFIMIIYTGFLVWKGVQESQKITMGKAAMIVVIVFLFTGFLAIKMYPSFFFSINQWSPFGPRFQLI